MKYTINLSGLCLMNLRNNQITVGVGNGLEVGEEEVGWELVEGRYPKVLGVKLSNKK